MQIGILVAPDIAVYGFWRCGALGEFRAVTGDSFMQDHLLVVDDDASLREALHDYLSANGFRVSSVADGPNMWRRLGPGDVDLIILDVVLAGDNGLDLCREVRARSTVPVIMLSARDGDIDRVVGLELGADDYLTKPFNPRVLLAQIRALLRRARSLAPTPEDIREYRFAGWILDVRTRQLVTSAEVVTPLGSAEFQLLKAFLERPKLVLSRDQLLDLTKGRDAAPFDRSIDMQISRLRRRLRENSRNPVLLKTVRNAGYVLSAEVERVF